MLTVIIGGARSGKSRLAQNLCSGAERVAYLATARLEDAEMHARAKRHRCDRPALWTTIEEPLALADAVRRAAPHFDRILVDCLTVWLGNLCWEHREREARELEVIASREISRLAEAATAADVILVSNEVGCGIVPENPVGRVFRDLQGLVNQQIARAADTVYLAVAGIALQVKPGGVAI